MATRSESRTPDVRQENANHITVYHRVIASSSLIIVAVATLLLTIATSDVMNILMKRWRMS